MKLSTTTDALSCLYGDAEALRRLAAIGYDAVDFSTFIYPPEFGKQPLSDLIAYFRTVRTAAEQAGIEIGQLHSPMVAYPNTPEKLAEYELFSLNAIEAAGVLGCPYIVVHPLIPDYCKYDEGHERAKAENMEFYMKLVPTLRRCKVKLAVENMFSWDDKLQKICPTVVSSAEEMSDYIDTLNEMAGEERFVACLDIGHATLSGTAPEHMIRVLGKRLQVLHVQDTDGVHDLHVHPFMGGCVNWKKVCEALAEVKYPGTFSFEADSFPHRVPASLWEDALRFGYAIGRKLISWIEDAR